MKKQNPTKKYFFRWLFYLFRYLYRKLKKAVFAFDGGYERSARLWMYAVLISVIATILSAVYVKTDFDKLISGTTNPSSVLAIALVKSLIVLAPLYAVKFSIRNYSANKHLTVINQHKAVVMKTVLGFISRKDLSPSLRGELLTIAIRDTFSTPETGYLVDRDGGTSIEQNIFDRINATTKK